MNRDRNESDLLNDEIALHSEEEVELIRLEDQFTDEGHHDREMHNQQDKEEMENEK